MRIAPLRLAKAAGRGPYFGPRGGKWADPEHTTPWKEEVTHRVHPHKVLFPHANGPVDYQEVARKDGMVQLSRHPPTSDGHHFGPWMSEESVKHFVNDLEGRVDVPAHERTEINAVSTGKAELLGKGDDGIAFRHGDKVVKVSTTVPYQPENPGHRSPKQAAEMLRRQVEVGNALAAKGIPGIQRSEFVEHGDKGFQIKPFVEIPERFTRQQLDAIRDTVLAMHEHGYALRDDIQAGLDTHGQPVLFDVGKAAPAEGSEGSIYSDRAVDEDRLRSLYRKHGAVYVNPKHSDGQKHVDRVNERLGAWLVAGKHEFAQREANRAFDLRAGELRASLAGKDLEAELLMLEFERESVNLEIQRHRDQGEAAPSRSATEKSHRFTGITAMHALDAIHAHLRATPSRFAPLHALRKSRGLFIGPHGGKWADAKHTQHWTQPTSIKPTREPESSPSRPVTTHTGLLGPGKPATEASARASKAPARLTGAQLDLFGTRSAPSGPTAPKRATPDQITDAEQRQREEAARRSADARRRPQEEPHARLEAPKDRGGGSGVGDPAGGRAEEAGRTHGEAGDRQGPGPDRAGTDDRRSEPDLPERRDAHSVEAPGKAYVPPPNPAIQLHADLLPPITVKLADDVVNFPKPDKWRKGLMPHQVEGAERILTAWERGDGCLLGDAAGLGKTFAALAALKARGGKRNLIVVPTGGKANLRRQWLDEAKTIGLEAHVGAEAPPKPGADGLWIVSYDELYGSRKVADPHTGKVTTIREANPAYAGSWDSVVFDECHSMGNPASFRSDFGKDLGNRAAKVLYMSATPFTNVRDMHYLNRLGMFHDDGSFVDWAKKAGAIVPEGAWKPEHIKNPSSPLPMAAIAATMHVDGLSIRRNTSLEGLTSHFEEVPPGALTPDARRTFEVASEIFDIARDNAILPSTLVKAFERSWARQYWETQKIPQVLAVARMALGEGKQVAIFTSFKSADHAHLRALANVAVRKAQAASDRGNEGTARHLMVVADQIADRIRALPPVPGVVKQLTDALGGPDKVAEVHGATNKDAQREQQAYQAGDKKILVATMAKGGTGLSFHDDKGLAPRVQINMSAPWSGREFVQVAGRSHRLGSQSATEMHWILGDDDNERHNAAIVSARLRSMGALTQGDPEATVDAKALARWEFGEDDDPEVNAETAESRPEPESDEEEAQAARDYFREFAERRAAGRDVLSEEHARRQSEANIRLDREARRAALQVYADGLAKPLIDKASGRFILHGLPMSHRHRIEAEVIGKRGKRLVQYDARHQTASVAPEDMPAVARALRVHENKVDVREFDSALGDQRPVSPQERLLAHGLHVAKHPTKAGTKAITGNTFSHKNAIYRAGGRWDASHQSWNIADHDADATLDMLASELDERAGFAKATLRLAPLTMRRAA